MRPPRVVIVSADHRFRTLLRAELREAGYDAIGATSLTRARRYPPEDARRGPVRLLIVDDAAATAPTTQGELEWARVQYAGSRFLLIRGGASAPPAGPWDKTLRRPLTIGEVVATVRELVPLPRELQRPLDE